MVVWDAPDKLAAVRVDHDVIPHLGSGGVQNRRFNAQDGNRIHNLGGN